ncbi:MAG TPA: hypothetical protein V6D33_13445 [Cyanophyceae cyanobacterium]
MKWFNKSSQIYSWFSPYPVFLGVLFSFALCSSIGRDVSYRNPFQHFHRFHQLISPESLFYPTARQLLELSQAKIPKSKIAVIIGGSSVFNGAGQSLKDLWTTELQRELGSRYKVLNFAFSGGGLPEHGAVAAQMLLRKGYQVIYVGDTTYRFIGEPDYRNETYRYVFWDAYYKGLIPHYQPRDNYLQNSLSPFSELRLNLQLDSITYSNDLWNTIGYKHFFTVWNYLAADNQPDKPFYLPRKQYPDPGGRYEPPSLEERLSKVDNVRELNDLRALCQNTFYKSADSDWIEIGPWSIFEQSLKIVFPEEFRKRSLIVVMYRNPYYLNQLAPSEQACVERAFSLTSEKFREAGYSSIELGRDFKPEDYDDGVHLVKTGGQKLARAVALEVKRMARELGYDE